MNEATRRQLSAARPDVSTWLSANAGSGKTRVLTDRVARLLLSGVSPQSVLCLTYTKAAASEMQNRLFRTLGTWAMMPDAALAVALKGLGEPATDPESLPRARRLFAQAIETPGGLRIQTIHSFCASVLRRFPLEAGVSPGFAEMDDRAAAQILADCIDRAAETAPDIFAALVDHVPAERLHGLVSEIVARRDRLEAPDEAALFAALDLRPGTTMADICAAAQGDCDATLFIEAAAALASGAKTDIKTGAMLETVTLPLDEAGLATLESCLLFAGGARAGQPKGVPTKSGGVVLARQDELDALAERVAAAAPQHKALATLERTRLLNAFAGVLLPLYARAKEARGWLDFDDLILRTRDLLTRKEVAEWVLYRLDGGIAHILVDEAQDTSPRQWDVIAALAAEIAAGDGARPAGARTVFVVGDRKQSIYSFQGADPDGFARMRDHFAERMGTDALAEAELQHSFRSSPAVLTAVDAVFGTDDRLGAGIRHLAFHDNIPGRVDLWPVTETAEMPPDRPWHEPVDTPRPEDATVRLARGIAGWIRARIDAGETLPRLENGTLTRRPMHEGDILILFRKRGQLFHQTVTACKAAGLKIAGADRIRLSDELAVRDILAVLRFLATPEDDLSLATVLRSPLFGWSEAALYDLAQPRGRAFLWQALRRRRDDHPDTLRVLDDLRGQADFLRPFELIDRLLLRHGGRARLIGRLGLEAAEGIDALLDLALTYERVEVPSLTGFLAWFDADDAEIKRQVEGAGQRLRVMTVHGAKGLEAPVVILPDTMSTRTPNGPALTVDTEGHVWWAPRKPDLPPPVLAAREAAEARTRAEGDRLLYVAMTRAAHWLIVAGAGDPEKTGGAWYGQVADGLAACKTKALETPFGPGLRLAQHRWSTGHLRIAAQARDSSVEIAPWFDSQPPPAPEPVEPIRPSDLGGAKALPGAAGDEDEIALSRGTGVHLLLEHLPNRPEADWPALAERLLPALDAEARAPLLAEARAVLTDPALAALFAPPALREVSLVAPGGAGRPILGTVDLLRVEAGRVLAVDFKSNRTIPGTPDAVPEGLLRQMGAYDAALSAIWPDHVIETALLWTGAPRLMTLPPALVRARFAGAMVP